MNKKTITLTMMALLAVVGVKADVIPSSYYSTVGEGTFYIYDITSQKFVGRETNRIAFEGTPTKTFTLTSGENGGYTIRYDLTSTYMIWNTAGAAQGWGSDFWMDANGVKDEGSGQYCSWNFTPSGTNTYKISTSYSYGGTTERTGGTARYLQGGVWSTTDAASAHEYAFITPDDYYRYLTSISMIPSSYFKETGVGTYYIYNVREGKFLRTVGFKENDNALLTVPVAVTLTSASGVSCEGGGDYILSGNASCFIKIGYFGGQWLWPNAASGIGDILAWTFNNKGSNTFTMSVTLESDFTQNGSTLTSGTYYMKNESNLSSSVGETGLYALISETDYITWQNSFNLSDANEIGFSAIRDIYNVNPTVNRAMTANVWNTLVIPFDMAIPAGWMVKEPTSFSDGTLTFGNASSIVAGKPYLVKPTEAVASVSATGVTLKKDLTPTTVGDLTMTGTYSLISAVPTGSYVLGTDNNLYRVNSTVSLKPFRAYFTVADGGAAARINIAFDDEQTTGVNDVRSKTDDATGYYNLQGQRVENPTKGLYIIHGKKVIIK